MAVAKENKVVHGNDLAVIGQEIKEALANKQNTISDLSTIRSGAAAGATAYQKPSAGIPSTDMTTAVQNSLGLANTSIQASDVQDIEGIEETLAAVALRKTAQTLTASEKNQVWSNLGIDDALGNIETILASI